MLRESDLTEVDRRIASRIEDYSDDFWASTDRDPREDLHAYFQYPAMMVPGLLRELVELVCDSQPGIRNVLDPFVGAGTTMTSCMPLGLDFTGQDINPLAILVSRSKTGPFFQQALPIKVERVLDLIDADENGKTDVDFINIDKWFQPEVQADLGKIRRAIRLEGQLWARRFFWVALAETARLTSNSRTSTYKLHVRPKDEIESREVSAIETFSEILRQNLEDFLAFKELLDEARSLRRGHYTGKLSIHLQDSAVKVLPPFNRGKKYDLLITSPPYGDNTSTVPYGQHSYLPLQWIDLKDIDVKAPDVGWLQTTQEIDRKSLGGRIPRKLTPLVKYLAERSGSYSAVVDSLKGKPRDRLARVTVFSFDLHKTLSLIVQSLRRNAYLIWIIGNRHVGGIEIPTDDILTEFLESYNVKLVTRATRSILFRRMASRNQIAGMMRQEHILVFRKVGK